MVAKQFKKPSEREEKLLLAHLDKRLLKIDDNESGSAFKTRATLDIIYRYRKRNSANTANIARRK